MEIDKVVDNMVAQMLVNDPIHELEACKGDGEKDTAVLVNVRGCHAEHLVQVLHIALRVRWRWAWRAISTRRTPTIFSGPDVSLKNMIWKSCKIMV